jgi:hypothetical protein
MVCLWGVLKKKMYSLIRHVSLFWTWKTLFVAQLLSLGLGAAFVSCEIHIEAVYY